MLNFQSYASGSAANLYTVDDGKTKVLIEMGLPIAKLKKALSYGLSKISFALLTHSHADHSKGVKEVMKAGIDIYTSQGTIDALELSGHRIHAIKALEQFSIGTWIIMPFDTIHDASEPLGFLMVSGKDKFCFITDTAFVKYKFSGLSILCIECNYQSSILEENIDSGICDPGLKARLLKTHLSLSNVIEFLKANDLSCVRKIFLMHLSARNANAKQMKNTIEAEFGKPVFTCGASNHVL